MKIMMMAALNDAVWGGGTIAIVLGLLENDGVSLLFCFIVTLFCFMSLRLVPNNKKDP